MQIQPGFTVVCQATGFEVRLHEPDTKTQYPLVTYAQRGSAFAVLMGRLYYQQKILAQLAPQESITSAAALALSVYCSLGSASLTRLEGDFALVIGDTERIHCIGMRDPLGGYPLFWTECDGAFILSTGLWPLLAIRPQRILDEEYFAEFLMMPIQRHEGTSERCAYAGIQRVLPGTIITYQASLSHITRHAYWDWLDQIKDPGTNNVAELANQYREYLHEAVRERLDGCVLAHLSGGMDSTSIALIARDEIRSQTAREPLHTLSLVYDHLSGLARERPYIEEVLQHAQAIIPHRLLADDFLDFDSFSSPPPHDEPYAGLWCLAMDQATINAAAQIGATTILTGLGADEIHDIQPYYLTDYLLKGRVGRAWLDACVWARAYHCNPWDVLYPFGIANLSPPWLISYLSQRRFRSSTLSLSKQNDWTVPPWILPEFARRYQLWDRAAENVHRMYRHGSNTLSSITLAAIENRVGNVLRWSIAAPLGIAIAHPFLDRRLLAFGMGMQLRFQPVPGVMKPILAQAMRNSLPEIIRTRRRKGNFNEIYYFGLSRNLRYLETMLQQAPFDMVKIFDKDKLLQCLQEAGMAKANGRQMQRLNYSLAIIKWFSQQLAWQQIVYAPTQIIHLY